MKDYVFGIIIISIIIYIFHLLSKNTENFNYIDINNAISFIKNDNDNFFKNMSIYDLRARKCSSIIEYTTKIIPDFIIDSDTLKKCIEKIRVCIESSNIKLNNLSKTFNDIKWKIIFFKGENYEDGMPHTRSDLIFIPVEHILNSSNDKLIRTLVHEKIHLLQRFYPGDKLITDFMSSYQLSDYKKNIKLARNNPDLNEFIYKNKNNEKMYYEYSSEYPSSINDVINVNYHEHPYEEMAYYFSQ